MEVPIKELVSIDDSTKKGNREGMTVFMHSSIPSEAPIRAVCPSMISIKIPATEPNITKYRLRFMTSPQKNL
jgi:hypothetical protein